MRQFLWRKKLILLVGYLLLLLFSLFNYNSRVTYVYPEYMTIPEKNFCQLPTHLGPVQIDMTRMISEEEIIKQNPNLREGGSWKPTNCTSWQQVAIVIPYRKRKDQLLRLLHRLHTMLQRQQISYGIFLVEQLDEGEFNRGKLLNIGVFQIMRSFPSFSCFVFHDVDLLPVDDRNIYFCDDHAHHLISQLDEMRFNLLYYNSLGGALAISKQNLMQTNGFSNVYWGWGNEDDDFNMRLSSKNNNIIYIEKIKITIRTNEVGMLISRPPGKVGRFKMIRHPKLWRNNNNYDLFLTWRSRWKTDGLNSLESNFELNSTFLHPLFTKYSVFIGKAPENIFVPHNITRESFLWLLLYYFP